MSFASPISLFRFSSSSLIYHVFSTYLAQSKKYKTYSWLRAKEPVSSPLPDLSTRSRWSGWKPPNRSRVLPSCPPSHHKCQFTVRQSLTRSGKSPKLGHILSSLTLERIQGELFSPFLTGQFEQICFYFLLQYNQEYDIFPLLILLFFVWSMSKDTGLSRDRQLQINWVFIFPDVHLILNGIKSKYILWEPVFICTRMTLKSKLTESWYLGKSGWLVGISRRESFLDWETTCGEIDQ